MTTRRTGFFLLAIWCLAAAELCASESRKAERVVLIVWDGMRPDFVSEQNTPALWKLASDGVTFARHHSNFPTSTNVNGVAMATGVYPNRSGIVANCEYRPEIDPSKPIYTQKSIVMQKGDEQSGGKFIAVPTMAETLQRAGFRTAIAGSKGVARFHDRRNQRENDTAQKSVTLSAGETIPASALESIVAAQGPFPPEGKTSDAATNDWTTKAMISQLWQEDVPKFSLLWLSEPDFSQHHTAPGAPEALAALKSADDNLASVLAALAERKLRDSTDVLVVSDHGFSTVSQSIDVPDLLRRAGFHAVLEFKQPPKRGDVMVAGNGGMVLFYVIEHDETVMERLVEFLQKSDFAGVIFSRAAIAGTFPLAAAHLDAPTAPDVVMSFRWIDDKNQFGISGMISADWQRKAGFGTHATLSPFDIHNTLIAAGPDFQRGTTSDLPSANVDIAPTILWLLGVDPIQPMDGRVLSEAFAGTNRKALECSTDRQEAKRDFGATEWRQYLKFSQLADHTYLDEGNAASIAK
jgi:predicted AlkP superfamily pyrophosphatase or phosphodiesterase